MIYQRACQSGPYITGPIKESPDWFTIEEAIAFVEKRADHRRRLQDEFDAGRPIRLCDHAYATTREALEAIK